MEEEHAKAMAKWQRTKGLTMIYKHLHRKTKDRTTPTLPYNSEFRCSRRASSSCFKSGIRRVKNPVISHEWGNDRIVTTNGTYPWSFVTQILRSGQPRHGIDRHFRRDDCNLTTRNHWCSSFLVKPFIVFLKLWTTNTNK
jgi:hypothetical protein